MKQLIIFLPPDVKAKNCKVSFADKDEIEIQYPWIARKLRYDNLESTNILKTEDYWLVETKEMSDKVD